MTSVKSLKYQVVKQGGGFIHRVHRSKKGRKKLHKGVFLTKDFKRRKEELTVMELDKENGRF